MVICEAEAPGAEVLGDLGQTLAEPQPLVAPEGGPARQRDLPSGVNTAALLGKDHDAAAHRRQQLGVSLHRRDLLRRRATEQARAVPAGGETQAMAREERPKLVGATREFAAELDARVPRLARLAQAH